MRFKTPLPVVWLVGGSSELGRAIATALQPRYNIVNVSRRSARSDSETFLNVRVDLADIPQVRSGIRKLLGLGIPRGVVFCQRYRPNPRVTGIDVLSAITTDILSTQAIIEQISNFRKGPKRGRRAVSVVIVSSVNGSLINKDLPFWYHWLKASQIHLARYYSVVGHGRTQMNVNCIAAGSFLKGKLASYPKSKRTFFTRLTRGSPVNRVCQAQDIARLVGYLISDDAAVLNGQILTLDGGLSNILQETLI